MHFLTSLGHFSRKYFNSQFIGGDQDHSLNRLYNFKKWLRLVLLLAISKEGKWHDHRLISSYKNCRDVARLNEGIEPSVIPIPILHFVCYVTLFHCHYEIGNSSKYTRFRSVIPLSYPLNGRKSEMFEPIYPSATLYCSDSLQVVLCN